MMRSSVALSAVGALAALLVAGPAQAQPGKSRAGFSHERECLVGKLDAASDYVHCVTDAFRESVVRGGKPSDHALARCDRHFDDAFDRAEKRGHCHSPGGAEPVRAAIKQQMLSTFMHFTAGEPCATLYIEPGYATCLLSTSQSSIDLEAVLDEINANSAVTTVVNDNTTLWIEAWGGRGGNGDDVGNAGNEGVGGIHGYAQMTTTVGAINASFGGTTLYYYLGHHGTYTSKSGGDGGTATLVTTQDVTSSLTASKILLIAAGGGGGGAGDGYGGGGCSYESGFHGGSGAVAISAVGAEKIISGDDGEDRPAHDWSGQGGGSGGNGGAGGSGGSAQSGANALAPTGGAGGNNANPAVGFYNAVTADFPAGGHGGSPGDGPAPGGGGGGGYSGGGGGVEATDLHSSCNAGGGGGGSSLAQASTETCSIAPTSMPTSPNGNAGFVEIGIDLGGCESSLRR